MNLLFIKYLLIFAIFALQVALSQTGYSLYINTINSSVGKTSITECSYLQNPAQFSEADKTIVSFLISPSKFGINDLTPFLAMVSTRFVKILLAGVIFQYWNNLNFSFSVFFSCTRLAVKYHSR